MKYLLLAILIGSSIVAPSAFGAQTLSFNTSDGERIDGSFYPGGKEPGHIAIFAPGFAQNRSTSVMKALCKTTSRKMDTFCLDFRGTGTSTGFYTFGQNEPLDLQPILAWAKDHYATVNLIGLSLGSYISGRAAFLWPEYVSKLLLISCPTRVEDIVMSGGAADGFWSWITHPNEDRTGANYLFRWGYPFGDKPDLSQEGPAIETPASFLVGQDDPLVFHSLSRKVYDSFAGPKTWDVFPDGGHAEEMYLQNSGEFVRWISGHLR